MSMCLHLLKFTKHIHMYSIHIQGLYNLMGIFLGKTMFHQNDAHGIFLCLSKVGIIMSHKTAVMVNFIFIDSIHLGVVFSIYSSV